MVRACVCVFVKGAPNIDVSSTLRAQLRKHTHTEAIIIPLYSVK